MVSQVRRTGSATSRRSSARRAAGGDAAFTKESVLLAVSAIVARSLAASVVVARGCRAYWSNVSRMIHKGRENYVFFFCAYLVGWGRKKH